MGYQRRVHGATMINGTEKPHRSEWPAQCESCNTNMTDDELLNASVAAFNAYTNQLPPVYHMCPGGLEAEDESEVWVPEGHEYHCCWNDDCGACDLDWCSVSFDQCGDHCSKPGTIDG